MKVEKLEPGDVLSGSVGEILALSDLAGLLAQLKARFPDGVLYGVTKDMMMIRCTDGEVLMFPAGSMILANEDLSIIYGSILPEGAGTTDD